MTRIQYAVQRLINSNWNYLAKFDTLEEAQAYIPMYKQFMKISKPVKFRIVYREISDWKEVRDETLQ
jgi:hypothetical protein